MRSTYLYLERISAGHEASDRATQMPLLGFVTGLGLALVLWAAIGGLAWALWG